MQDAPVFIVGAGRSGTTLMADLLGLHPRISPIYETDFVTQLIELLLGKRNIPSREAAELIVHCMNKWTAPLPHRPHFKREHERYLHGPHYILFDREFAMEQAHILASEVKNGRVVESLRFFLAALFSEHCRRDNKPRWLNKTPVYLHFLPQLQLLFPNLRVIHCVRDGRDAACSAATRPWGPKTYADAAKWWVKSVAIAESFRKQNPKACLLIRYEDLLNAPEKSLQTIFHWLNEPDASFEILQSYHRAGISFDPGRTNQWRKTLSYEEISDFQEIAGNLLVHFGYPVEMINDPIFEEFRRFILAEILPKWWKGPIEYSTKIGSGGFGLDSIATVELLLACERQWQKPFPAELLEQGPLTVGKLVDHLKKNEGNK